MIVVRPPRRDVQRTWNRAVGWTTAIVLNVAGLCFTLIGFSVLSVERDDPGSWIPIVVGLGFGALLQVRGAMCGATRTKSGVRARNFERTYSIHKGAAVGKELYPHGASPFLFTSPVVTLDDGSELLLTGLKVFAFIDKWTHTTDKNVAKLAAWLEPDDAPYASP